MAGEYILPADFRAGTLQSWSQGYPLTTGDASDAMLTDVISEMSDQFDEYTLDHFSPEPAASTTTLLVNGNGGTILEVPKRIRSITQLETQDWVGVWTVQLAATYRYDAFTGDAREVQRPSVVELVRGQILAATGWYGWEWPTGLQTVRLTGTFSWPSTPLRVKQAIAMMVWDRLKPSNAAQMRADRSTADGVQYEYNVGPPSVDEYTGIPEVDRIICQYRRPLLLVG